MRKLTIITCFFLVIPAMQAQEKVILYSHYSFNGLAINPAYTGSHEMLTINLSHRSQWIGFDGAPSYNIFGIHTPFKNTKMGLGLLVMNESIGLRRYTGFYFNYAHRIKLGPGRLAFGLKGGIATGKIESVDLGNDDNVFGERSSSFWLPNFGLGIYYYTRNLYTGVSVPLILGYETNETGEVTAYHDFKRYAYYITAGIKLRMADNWKLQPSTLMEYDKAGGLIVDGGMSILYKDLLRVGGSYRNKLAIVMLMDYKVTYQLRLGIAYEYGLSSINEYNRNSFEIALEYNFGYQIKASDPTKF